MSGAAGPPMRLRGLLAGTLLAGLGLPREPAGPVDDATARRFAELAATDGPVEPPAGETLRYLQWLLGNRSVLFHGSPRGGLSELSTRRESGDSTKFGAQTAVFATDAPVWALWFALLVRGPGFASTRNGAWSVLGRRSTYHFFSVNVGAPSPLASAGWIYVLPREGFRAQPPVAGVLDAHQWVNDRPVRPLSAVPVQRADFPFADRVGRHRAGESMVRTLLRQRSGPASCADAPPRH